MLSVSCKEFLNHTCMQVSIRTEEPWCSNNCLTCNTNFGYKGLVFDIILQLSLIPKSFSMTQSSHGGFSPFLSFWNIRAKVRSLGLSSTAYGMNCSVHRDVWLRNTPGRWQWLERRCPWAMHRQCWCVVGRVPKSNPDLAMLKLDLFLLSCVASPRTAKVTQTNTWNRCQSAPCLKTPRKQEEQILQASPPYAALTLADGLRDGNDIPSPAPSVWTGWLWSSTQWGRGQRKVFFHLLPPNPLWLACC